LTVRGRKLRAGMANKKGDDVWGKKKSPWRAKLGPTDEPLAAQYLISTY
jgi:hypothetical protein